MKKQIKRFSKSTLAVVLTLCMLLSCVTAGIVATNAAQSESGSTGAKIDTESVGDTYFAYVHFAVPSTWDMTGQNLYLALSWGNNYYRYYKMTNLDHNLYYYNGSSVDHYSGQERVRFVVSSSAPTNGSVSNDDFSSYTYYTAACSYSLNDNSNYYGFFIDNPDNPGTTDVAISGNWNSHLQSASNSGITVKPYTNGSSSYTGGTVAIAGKQFNGGNATMAQNVDSTGTSTSYDYYCPVGTKVTLTANSQTGYSFAGFYDKDDNLLSSTSPYSFISYAKGGSPKEIRAKFTNASYYVTSAGASDDDDGFTTNHWVVNDPLGAMTETTSGVYTKTFTGLPIGAYRFKVTNGTWATSYGDDTHVKYEPATGFFSNCYRDNNTGNACFTLTAAADITITFDSNHISDSSSEHPMLTVSASPATVPDKYYIVGQASDGTRGMFYNVWGENWTSFNDADLVMSQSTPAEGTFTKEYTDFRGTTGTYTYKVIRVQSDGTIQYFPNDGDGQTVNVTGKTTKVTFSVTTDATGAITAVTATPTEGSANSDATYDPKFNKTESGYSDNSDRYLMMYTGNDNYQTWTNRTSYVNSSDSSIKVTTVKNGNDYYFKIPKELLNGTNKRYIAVSTSNSGYSGIHQTSTNDPVNVASRASSYLSARGEGNNINNDGERKFSYVKFNNSDAQSSFNYIVLHFNKSTYAYEYDVYGSGGGGTVTTLTTVDIYAKNGTLRDSDYNRFTNLANTDIVSITDPDGIVHTSNDWTTASKAWNNNVSGEWNTDKSGYSSNYDKVTKVPIGSTIKLRTYLSGNTSASQVFQSGKAFKDTHYLKAYSINGMTYQLHKASEAKTTDLATPKFNAADEYYEEEWKVEAVNTANMGSNHDIIEITPIYYMKDNSNCKTFYIDGYIGDLQTKWGTMLCVYPYYEGASSKSNAFGGYPGQPMLYWGGKFQMEIPLTHNGLASGKQFKGLTMHNSYWDLMHRGIDKKCDDGHCQTYDYDDFHKLYKEKTADTIYYWFKYKTSHDNFASSGEKEHSHKNFDSKDDYQVYDFADSNQTLTAATAAGWNGVELVTDYYGRQVDVFGNLLTSAQQSTYNTTPTQTKELLIVSTGYRDTFVGDYATLWAVYAPQSSIPSGSGDTAGKFIGYISSSMLYLNNFNRVDQYTNGTNTGAGEMSWSKFKDTYNHLKTYYTGVPALISYEREIYNNSYDKANRSDGKWFYSMGNDKISANIKIQYTTKTDSVPGLTDVTGNASTGWADDTFNMTEGVTGYAGEHNIGRTTGCSAYFTNTTPVYLVGKTSATDVLVDNEKFFTFQAQSGGTYEFVGWVRECGGEYNEIVSTNALGQSNISANDTYIARFKPVATGKLVISHNIVKTSTYQGDGTKYLKVQILDNSNNVKKEYIREDGTDVDVSDYINSTTYSANYKIKVTVRTVPSEDCTVAARSCVPDDSKYKTDTFTPTPGATLTQEKTFNVSDVFDGTSSTVTAVRYYTSLRKTPINYTYSITYHYTSRFWGDQSYTVKSDTAINELEAEKYFSGTKTGALLNDEFIKNNTPYEKNFRQKIDWNYTGSSVTNSEGKTAAAMTKGNIKTDDTNYVLTADVYSANTVDDKVKAEFLLPYKYTTDADKKNAAIAAYKAANPGATDAQAEAAVGNVGYSDKKSTGLPVFNSQSDTTPTGNTEIGFDDQSYESFTIESQVGRLFQYTNVVPELSGASHHAYEYDLVEAAPYVLYKTYNTTTNTGTAVDFHTKKTSGKRSYTGNSFKVGDVTYYKDIKDVPDDYKENGAIKSEYTSTHKILTVTDKVHFLKPGKVDSSENYTDYYFAVEKDETVDGVTYKTIYFFAYALDANENPIGSDGHVLTAEEKLDSSNYVFYGQYIMYSEYDEIDGIIANNNYVKKYFTRWDVYNTNGEKVTSSYYRQFNYSGYENYLIKPVYESDSPSAAAEASNGLSASISYLGDSRNQWKGTSSSDMTARGDYNTVTGMTDATYQGDKIFTDFAIAFNYNDQQINEIASSTEQIKIGMVIEKLDPVIKVGEKAITDPSYYAGLDSYNQFDVDSMKAYINYKLGNTSPNPGRPNDKSKTYGGKTGSSNGVTFVQIASNADGFVGAGTGGVNYTGKNQSMLDNKNRLEYFYTFTKSRSNAAVADFDNNSATAGNIRPYDCVYRVTSFIYASGNTGDPLVVSSPVYLTIYDTATR